MTANINPRGPEISEGECVEGGSRERQRLNEPNQGVRVSSFEGGKDRGICLKRDIDVSRKTKWEEGGRVEKGGIGFNL